MSLSKRNYLIFDLDGTLIDSSEGVIKATNYALTVLGDSVRSASEIRRFIGYPLEDMFKHFSDNSYQDLLRCFQEKAMEVMAASTVPISNTGKILETLHKIGYKMGIGTTKIRIHINSILDKFNWLKYFDTYIGADDVSRVKPDPEVFNKVMNILGSDKDNTLVIGDTVNDVLAAQAASIPIIAIKSIYGGYDKLKKSSPDFIINNLDELPVLLKKLKETA